MINKNEIFLKGVVTESFTHHCYYKDKELLKGFIKVKRISNNKDILPVIINAHDCDKVKLEKGNYIKLNGNLRTKNIIVNGSKKVELYVFAYSIDNCKPDNRNSLILEGFVSQNPKYWLTPSGRHICEIIIANNRQNNSVNYIPCIFWDLDTENVKKICVGEKLTVKGRLQSRNYIKIENGQSVTKVTYEVSVSNFVHMG